MFGVSLPELVIIFAVCLIVFGPDKLPELASKLGRFSSELRKHSDGIRREFYNSVYKPAETIQGETNRGLVGLRNEVLGTEPYLSEAKNNHCQAHEVKATPDINQTQKDESSPTNEPTTTS